ncbi:MAG TPA: dihydrofolate reductase family protein, partial [Cyclobacteriaceae bacterium]|nr:dihydrofolate reductase family protein [Cyclobacteriaceae bacterium]
MRKIVQFMHVSLDGFVAGPNGEMDWITVDDEIFDYAGNRTDNSDMALYGRVTFDMMENYWPTAADVPNPSKHTVEHSAWYKGVAKVVLSKTLKGKNIRNTTVISDNIAAEVQKLKQGSDKEIIIFGSPGASHTLMAEGLIDEFWIFVSPILVGTGIPLFKN